MPIAVFINGKRVSFEDRFPDIENIKLNIGEGKNTLGKEDIGISIPCGNPTCEGKGFNIDNFISMMYFKRETSKEEIIKCDGYEKMGGKNRRDCINYLKVKCEIKYKN
jgi:hypothetical protein